MVGVVVIIRVVTNMIDVIGEVLGQESRILSLSFFLSAIGLGWLEGEQRRLMYKGSTQKVEGRN